MRMKISKQQSDIIFSKTRGRIFLGSIGSGKTYTLSLCAIHDCLSDRATLITSYSYRNLKDVVLTTFKDILENSNIDFTINYSELIIKIDNAKYPIILRTADNPDKLRSYNLHSVYLEEARELNRETYDILLGRLRLSEDCQWSMFTTTRGKDYVYDIIESNDLLNIFENDCRLAQNENLTVVRSVIDECPFLPQSYIDDLKKQYSTTFAQQELYALIVDGTGSIINPKWIQFDSLQKPTKGVRFWDLAFGRSKEADYSVGTLMSKDDLGKYKIHDIKRVKLEYPELKKLIIDTAINDGPGIHLGLEDVMTQRAIVDDISRESLLSNHILRRYRPTKDKISRSLPFASQCELSNVICNKSHWNRLLLDEISRFSSDTVGKSGYHDDQIDSLVGSYYILNQGHATLMGQMG